MGCVQSQKQGSSAFLANSMAGTLRVHIGDAHIDHETSSLFRMDPYIKVKLSNYSFTSPVKHNGGLDPRFDFSLQFILNTCHKVTGRQLEIGMWDQGQITDSEIGYGILDLDQVITNPGKLHNLKCHLNYKRKEAGYVTLTAQFVESPSDILSFRFESSLLQRKLRTIGHMKVKVRVTLGQEILQTKAVKDREESDLKWPGQVLIFLIPSVLEEGKIQLIDDEKVIGEIKLNVKQLMNGDSERSFYDDLKYKDSKGHIQVAGTLRYLTIVGQQENFMKFKSALIRKVKAPRNDLKRGHIDDHSEDLVKSRIVDLQSQNSEISIIKQWDNQIENRQRPRSQEGSRMRRSRQRSARSHRQPSPQHHQKNVTSSRLGDNLIQQKKVVQQNRNFEKNQDGSIQTSRKEMTITTVFRAGLDQQIPNLMIKQTEKNHKNNHDTDDQITLQQQSRRNHKMNRKRTPNAFNEEQPLIY